MIFDAASLEELPFDTKRYYLRLQLSSDILLHLLSTKGEKVDKAWAAVGYADALLNRLNETTTITNLEIKKNNK